MDEKPVEFFVERFNWDTIIAADDDNLDYSFIAY